MDSLLSIVQMPGGIPVGTLAIGNAGAINAALLAASILALSDKRLSARLDKWRAAQTDGVALRPSNTSGRTPDTKIQDSMIEPGATIGILGGGQLGPDDRPGGAGAGLSLPHLLPREGQPGQAGDTARHHRAAYENMQALSRFAKAVDVVTFEFENVPGDTAEFLAERKPVRPGPSALRIAQDRIKEKDFLRSIGVATAPYQAVTSRDDLRRAVDAIGPARS